MFETNGDLLTRIKSKLKSEFYSMNDDWLKDCIEFYVEQHRSPSNEEILQFVKVQWQLSDLREINNESGCLPHNLSQQKLVTLSGNYVLQVEQMYDISTAKYKQLQQIRNTHISEVDPTEAEKLEKWEPPKKRMLQLRLTDGIQDVLGIEYSYMASLSKLNEVLLPGYKVMIIGPVKCRKGVLLLQEGNLKGIGGEVDKLLIPNALENVLARALNLEQNPDPYNDNVSKSNNVKQANEPQANDSFFEEDFDINLDEVSKIEDSHGKNHRQSNTNPTKRQVTLESFIDTRNARNEDKSNKEIEILDDDDCIIGQIDEALLVESQTEQTNIPASFRALPTEENDEIIVINDEDMMEEVEFERFSKNPREEKSISYSSVSRITDKRISSSNKSSSKTSNNHRESSPSLSRGKRSAIPMSPETVTVKRGKMDRKITEFTKLTSSPDIPKICEFICDINNAAITETTFRTIRGRVEVLGKLGKKDSMWLLEATIEDGTGKIDVSFSNEVLQGLLGFSVQEFSQKKKMKKNPEIENELRMSFRNAEQRIRILDDLMELELNANKKPKVIKIIDLTQEKRQLIDKRLENFLNKSNK